MLLLVEVHREKQRGQIEFQDKLVIELDNDNTFGLRRAGELFDEIFEIAKKTVNLNRFGSGVRMYYIRGKAVKRIIGALKGEWIEAVSDAASDVMRFRIKVQKNKN